MVTSSGQYYLYRHIRLDRYEVFYIGIGCKSYAKRLDRYDRAFSKCRTKHWINITNKIPYKVEILLESNDRDFIIRKEIEFIALYGRRDLGKGTLVNLTNGGEGVLGRKYKPTKEAIVKMRKSLTGKKRTKEQCLAISKGLKNRISPMLGKKHKPEFAEMMKKLHTGKKVSKETREKLRLLKIGIPVSESTYSWRYKKVDQFDKEGLFIKSWDNIRDAAHFYNVGNCEISTTCKAQRGDYPKGHKSFNRKTCKGFIWKYKQN